MTYSKVLNSNVKMVGRPRALTLIVDNVITVGNLLLGPGYKHRDLTLATARVGKKSTLAIKTQ